MSSCLFASHSAFVLRPAAVLHATDGLPLSSFSVSASAAPLNKLQTAATTLRRPERPAISQRLFSVSCPTACWQLHFASTTSQCRPPDRVCTRLCSTTASASTQQPSAIASETKLPPSAARPQHTDRLTQHRGSPADGQPSVVLSGECKRAQLHH